MSLPDLPEIMSRCTLAVNSVDVNTPVLVREDVWESIKKQFLSGAFDSANVIENKTLAIKNDNGQYMFITAQELPVARELVPYLKALNTYNDLLGKFAEELGFASRKSGEGKVLFRQLPATNWQEILDSALGKGASLSALKKILPDNKDLNLMNKFLGDAKWSGIGAENGGGGRKFDRSTDWMNSGLQKVGNWIASASTGRDKVVRALYEVEDLESALVQVKQDASLTLTQASTRNSKGGVNQIYFGAPGTGKTYKIDKQIKDRSILNVRTVFHPDVQNSDFVGSLKPVMREDKVTYAFAPGPFSEALSLAYRNLDKPVFLVIEEINRAAAAAVFGDLFLLLDRGSDGQSQYSVAFPNEEFKKWFCERTETRIEELRLPSNLSIYATMNSADQGVYPLDTAFRRRWKQEYLPLDFDAGTVPLVDLKIVESSSNTFSIKWGEFANNLNAFLQKKLDIQEDRLIGPYFISVDEVVDGRVPEKLLVYLWDDLLRHGERSRVFQKSIGTYGELVANISEGKVIWSDDVLAVLTPASE